MRDFTVLDQQTCDAIAVLFRFADDAQQFAHDNADYKAASLAGNLIGSLDRVTDDVLYIAATQGAKA